MKNYLRILAASTLLTFGLTQFAIARQATATQSTSTDTSSTKSKRSRKKKSTDTSASVSAKPAPAQAAPATAPAPSSSPSTMSKKSGPAPNASVSDTDIAAAKAAGKVWVNTETKVYHKSGQFYGKTKHGQFMTESDAQKAGYRPAKSEVGSKKS